MKPVHYTVLFLTLLIATACLGNRYPFTCSQLLPDSGWAYGDTITFSVNLSDTTARGNLMIDIAHDNSYTYSNLWLEMTRSTGMTEQRDTLEVTLCDSLGHWLGHGVEGYYQLETTICDDAILADSATISLRHIMRVDTLQGLSRIGLTLKTP